MNLFRVLSLYRVEVFDSRSWLKLWAMLNRRDLGTKLLDALNVIVEGCNEMGPKRDRICAGLFGTKCLHGEGIFVVDTCEIAPSLLFLPHPQPSTPGYKDSVTNSPNLQTSLLHPDTCA